MSRRVIDYWAVIHIESGELRIVTTAGMRAADELKFGCCYGHGLSRGAAIVSAQEQRETFISAGYRSEPLPMCKAA